MPQLGEVTAWIEVDGVRLEEFKTETHLGPLQRKVSCWVVSEEGKDFTIHWGYINKNVANRGILKLDGKSIQQQSGYGVITTSDMMVTTETGSVLARMKFGKLILSDDENADLLDDASAAALGVIQMDIDKGTIITTAGIAPPAPQEKTISHVIPSLKPVHEKTKKAGCHRIIPGSIVSPIKGPTNSATIPIRSSKFIADGSAKTTFMFYYRPRELLQAMDVIPKEVGSALEVYGRELKEEGLAVKAEEKKDMEQNAEADKRA